MRTITIDIFSGRGIEELQKAVESEEKRLRDGTARLVRQSAERGRDLSKGHYAEAQYDGTHGLDNVEALPGGSDNEMIVRLSGPTAQFIEFGTGVYYPDNYPEPVGQGKRGTFGSRQGRNVRGWHYHGDKGSSGEVEQGGKWKGWVHTYGNPANAPLYYGRKDLLDETQELVNKAFESST